MLLALLGERETVMKAKETLLDEVCIRKSNRLYQRVSIQILTTHEGNNKNYFPKVIKGNSFIASKSLRGITLHYFLKKEESMFVLYTDSCF